MLPSSFVLFAMPPHDPLIDLRPKITPTAIAIKTIAITVAVIVIIGNMPASG